DPRVRVEISADAAVRVQKCREQIEALVSEYIQEWEKDGGHPVLEYGVTTGFGEFKNIAIAPDCLLELQRNILLSHSVGIGETADPANPANYFEPDVVRAALAIRLNAFLKGNSGVRLEIVRTVQAMLNRGIVPLVPIRGSVGSSGDLCPLSHLFVVLLGEGQYYIVREAGDLAYGSRDLRGGLAHLAEDLGIDEVPSPSYKEGLALTNGATFSAALLAMGVLDAERAAHAADVACALSLEAVCGCARAFDARVHEARGLEGQKASAANIRALIKGSKLIEKAGAVQDVYSLRCAPAVHGATRDAIAYARKVAEAEINAATDNPLFFSHDDAEPFDWEFAANWPEGYDGRQRISYSAGNFHGEPVGMAADVLAIGVAELANISERRTQMLLDAHHNRNLPGNLIPRRGINSGYMIAQYAAAGVVSENKVLTHPATVDSIPTSANSEDHNAMATIAARKLRTVLRNVQAVLAIELLVAAQGVEWRVAMEIDPRPKKPDAKDEAKGSRETGGADRPSREAPSEWERAEQEAQEFGERTRPEKREEIAKRLGKGTGRAYLKIREVAPPMLTDKTLDGEIRAVRHVLEYGSPLD
ncbi:MAG TPA: aromatic amino acid lyase, partial [Thermoanaerobaculia bacterium]|nr:aromatic amino acid lyase [Thermoanaerobaculia bacterium]